MKKLFALVGAVVAALAIAGPAHASTGHHFCGTSNHGWDVSASASTSCRFAWSTYYGVKTYQSAHGGVSYGARFHVYAWSPATRRDYRMDCRGKSDAAWVTCRGGHRASVTIIG
jgi:hypothetical protein